MKLLTRISFCLVLAIFLAVTTAETSAQTQYPPISQKAMMMQKIGDTDVMITYHRPNVKGRKLWGSEAEKALVPNGKVWRTGANAATVFEVTNDVMINGKKLPKGKYSFYAIPNADQWILIFNKSWNQGGTTYDEKKDALRVMSKPIMTNMSVETLRYSAENVRDTKADIHLAWGKARIPFTVDVGDVSARLLNQVSRNINNEKVGAANYIFSSKQSDKYEMAMGWLNSVLAEGDNYGAYFVKARLLGEMGKKSEAIATAKKGVSYGKANNVNPGSVRFLESLIQGWMK